MFQMDPCRVVTKIASCILLLCIFVLAAWDGTRPCLSCGCLQCGESLTHICESWFSWKENWQEQWSLDMWPVLWMGTSILVLITLPIKFAFLGSWAIPCLHCMNIIWMMMSALPLTWRSPKSDGCAKASPRFQVEYLGIVFGRLCGINMALLLLTIGRVSAWLDKAIAGYQDSVAIHRIAGWWCAFHTVMHGLLFLIVYYMEGGWSQVTWKCLPIAHGNRINTRGLKNFWAVIATLATLAIAAFSLPSVRRKRFQTFYNVHVVSAVAFIILGSLHDFELLFFSLAASSYFVDRACAILTRRKCKASLISCQPAVDVACIQISCTASQRTVPLIPGTRWIYVKFPCISRDWHPFSICGTNDAPMIHVKAAGDWSQSVVKLAGKQSQVDVYIDGPYGVTMSCPLPIRNALSKCSPASPSHLILIAGGVGVVPFADILISASGDSSEGPWKSILLIWAVRTVGEFMALEKSLELRACSRKGVSMRVHITGDVLDVDSAGNSDHRRQNEQRSDHIKEGSKIFVWQIRIINALVPGVGLFATLHIQQKLEDVLEPWKGGLLSWGLCVRGGLLLVAHAVWSSCAVLVALNVWVAYTSCKCFTRMTSRVGRQHDNGTSCRDVSSQALCDGLQDLHGGEVQNSSFAFAQGRPDLAEVIPQEASSEKTTVKACGPRRLLESVKEVVQKAKSHVKLEIEDSEW